MPSKSEFFRLLETPEKTASQSILSMLSRVQYQNMGKEAAENYILDMKAATLADKVAEIAFSKGLNADQIQRVCESANHATNMVLIKQAQSDKLGEQYIKFPVADAGIVIEKVAEMSEVPDEIYSNPDAVFRNLSKESSPSSLSPTVAGTYQKTAREIELIEMNIKKIANVVTDLENEKTVQDHEAKDDFNALYDEVRSAVLEGEEVDDIGEALARTFSDGNEFSLIWDNILQMLTSENIIPREPIEGDRPTRPDSTVMAVNYSDGMVQIAARLHKRFRRIDEIEKQSAHLRDVIGSGAQELEKKALFKEALVGKLVIGGAKLIGKAVLKTTKTVGGGLWRNKGRAVTGGFVGTDAVSTAAKKKITIL